ncbi:AraC family transcriptional regulator [Paenibacillus glycanilyticus]|uniref:AraC family transcriptional regulator n=1 Tax=Paenibacillus glycanilyticus TaxID=126569 RepID=UPI00203C00FF|nr:AraC family transcriptional regulator [Paenibacillus glycanilyticus]MCM3628903.1 AraC family transcriptional regulator [Paenibacillus glycanilyticus]
MTASGAGEDIQSHLLYAGKVSDSPNWNFPSHKHDDLHEVIVICEGEGMFTIGGRSFRVSGGDILVYNKGVLHEEQSSSDNPLTTYYCGFTLPQASPAEDWVIPHGVEPVIRSSRAYSEIAALMKMIVDESSIKEEGYERISRYLINSVILLLRRTVRNQQHVKEQETNASLAEQIKDYIDRNFTQNVSLKDLGRQFHVNPYYVSHVFKDYYQISPINYAIHRRIGEATRLLVSTEMKVWEIAKLLGYDNPNYFSIIFRRVTGLSPNRFRESNQQNLFPR